jgi:hypothetical protein
MVASSLPGFELLLAADIRIASADALFSQIEVRRGIYRSGHAAEDGPGTSSDAIGAPPIPRFAYVVLARGDHMKCQLVLILAGFLRSRTRVGQ